MSTIGIDLGTTNSCVAVHRKGQVEIIQNDQGSRVTPSFVSFTEDERLVGDAAKQEAPFNFENTLFQMKRLIGRTYDDPIVQADMNLWGFSVINDDNKPKIPVISNSQRKICCPEEVSAMVLESLKKTAEDRLGEPVKDVVITVPAYFNDAQRSATKDAGTIAGLNVVRMINEPTAAAIAYGLDRKSTEKQSVLVFDLGGGTFDVTVVNIEEGIFDVQAVGGDTHLGGDDFDNCMVNHFVAEFNTKHHCDISKDKMALSRLRVACEASKRQLSVKTAATVQVDGLHNGKHFRSKISRAKFEELNYEYFSKTMHTVKDTLADANMNKDEISTVILVGGSTRIPKIQELLSNFFGKDKVNKTINPDESVAIGAAALTKSEFTLHDVTPLSLGWKDTHGAMITVVKRNTKLPTKKWHSCVTSEDYQTSVPLRIFEGERAKADENHYLGMVVIDDIPPALKGVEKFRMCFTIDVDGLLTVTNRNVSTGKTNKITIGNESRLTPHQVVEMMEKAKKFKREDAKWKERTNHLNQLEEFVYALKHAVDDIRLENVEDEDKTKIVEKCEEITEWIEEQGQKPEVIQSKQKYEELENTCAPILRKVPEGSEFLRELKNKK